MRFEASMARKRRSFTAECKAEVAWLCTGGDRDVHLIAKHLDLTDTADLKLTKGDSGLQGGRGLSGILCKRPMPSVRG